MEILSQRDPRWSNIKLGTSDKTIGSHGCTITCVAMLAGTTPDVVNQKLLAVGGYAEGNLIIWSKINAAIPWLKWEWRGYEYENDKVASSLPCLVEVDGSRIGGSRHWVVYIGNQQMLDPWYGNQKSTSYYPPTGYSIIKKIGSAPSQEVVVPKETFEKLVKNSTEYDKIEKLVLGFDGGSVKEKVEWVIRNNQNLQNQVQETDNSYDTLLLKLSNTFGCTKNEDQVVAIAKTRMEELTSTKNNLLNSESEIDSHIDGATQVYGSPLTTLKAVLDAFKLALQAKNTPNEPIVIELPVIERFIRWIKSKFGWR